MANLGTALKDREWGWSARPQRRAARASMAGVPSFNWRLLLLLFPLLGRLKRKHNCA
jgi:hypothetical protein